MKQLKPKPKNMQRTTLQCQSNMRYGNKDIVGCEEGKLNR
jgi:hypothetical protein